MYKYILECTVTRSYPAVPPVLQVAVCDWGLELVMWAERDWDSGLLHIPAVAEMVAQAYVEGWDYHPIVFFPKEEELQTSGLSE